MRALGLPNTKHFHEITRIEDALARKGILFHFYFAAADVVYSSRRETQTRRPK